MSEKVTFQELIDSIAKETNNSKKFTHDFLKDLVSVINSGLESDGSVNIAGLGKFRLRRMNEREGYNPQTGEKMTIETHNKVVFKPYKDLRELVNAAYLDEEPKLIEEDQPDAPQEDTEDTLEERKGHIPAVPPTGSDAEEAEAKTDDADEDQAPWEAGEEEEREAKEDPFGISDSEEGTEDQDKDVVEYQPDDKEGSSLDRHLDKVKKQQSTPDPEEEEVETEQEPVEEPEPVMASGEESRQEDTASYIPSFQNKKETPAWVWGAAAVVGLLIIVFAVLFFSSGDSAEQQAETLATTQPQSEQVTEQPGQQESQSQGDQAQAQTATSGTESESQSEANAQTAGQGEGNNQPQQLQQNDPIVRSVARGQTLWGLAKKEYEDPYLWPWIYDANKSTIRNPDVILVGQTLSIPVPDEENYGLSSTDSLEVAIGYVETYRWYKNNGRDQAKFYLWAAKIYDQNVFDHVTQPIDEDDLAFANRVR